MASHELERHDPRSAAARYDLDPPFRWSRTTIGVGATALVLAVFVALFPSVAATVIDHLADLA